MFFVPRYTGDIIIDITGRQVALIRIMDTCTTVVPKVSGLTYKNRAKWKMLLGIYSAIYDVVTVSVAVCVEMKGDYIEK